MEQTKGKKIRAYNKNWIRYPDERNQGSTYYKHFIPLHVYVWELYHGCPVPAGYEVHHIDSDKENFAIENLVALPEAEHRKLHHEHNKARPDYRERMIELARVGREYVKEHGVSEEGRRNLVENGIRNMCLAWEDALLIDKICSYCGNIYQTYDLIEEASKFCSCKCKAAARRKSGIDNETRICVYCGNKFTINKYTKTKTCSKKCSAKYRAQKEGNAKFQGTCLKCKKEIWIYPSARETTKFCSRICKYTYRVSLSTPTEQVTVEQFQMPRIGNY